LRLRPAAALGRELAAWAAARSVVPVPLVVDIVHLEATSAALLERLPGRPAGDLAGLAPDEAKRRGLACGRVHPALARVAAPDLLPPAAELVTPSVGAAKAVRGDRLLHLDLHPFNVLVDDGEQVSGIIDWANAAAGNPDLDRARSASIFRWDPAAGARRADPAWAALYDGWEEAGGLLDLPRAALVWAGKYMLADLASRYNEDQLSEISKALDDITGAGG
jgi:Ser/Thr protein kinase RdoA (MazF antagonist)